MNIKEIFNPPAKVSAVIVAAGKSVRMGTDKTVMELGGYPVIIRTLRAFENCSLIDEIIVVTRADKIEETARLIRTYGIGKVTKVISGGETRTESSLAGVSAVRKNADYIAIHDGVRPFVTEDLIAAAIEGAKKYRAAVPGIPVVDTMKKVSNGYADGNVDRDTIVRIQTPQVFEADLIKGALTYVVENKIQVTDDSSAVEYMGFKVRIVPGAEDNLKLTTAGDIEIANSIIRKRGSV